MLFCGRVEKIIEGTDKMGVAKAGITLTSGVIRRILNELGELTEQGKSFDDAIATLIKRFGDSRVRDTIKIAGERITQYIRQPVAEIDAAEAARRAEILNMGTRAVERARGAQTVAARVPGSGLNMPTTARTVAAARTAARQAAQRQRPASLAGEVPAAQRVPVTRAATPHRHIRYGEGPFPQDYATEDEYLDVVMSQPHIRRLFSPKSAANPEGTIRAVGEIVQAARERWREAGQALEDAPASVREFLRRPPARRRPEDAKHFDSWVTQAIRNRSNQVKLSDIPPSLRATPKATGGLVTQKKSKVKKAKVKKSSSKKTNTKKKVPVKKSRKRQSVKNTRTKK